MGMPGGLPLWLGVGALGLWPLSPPFPVKIRQVVGEPIPATEIRAIDPDDSRAVAALHRRVMAAVQSLLDTHAR